MYAIIKLIATIRAVFFNPYFFGMVCTGVSLSMGKSRISVTPRPPNIAKKNISAIRINPRLILPTVIPIKKYSVCNKPSVNERESGVSNQCNANPIKTSTISVQGMNIHQFIYPIQENSTDNEKERNKNIIEKMNPVFTGICPVAMGLLRIVDLGAILSISRSAQKSRENPDTARHHPIRVTTRELNTRNSSDRPAVLA